MYAATILADSINQRVRLTTLQVTFPRFILAEFNTHRALSRNRASSRAIPVKKRIEEVINNPFIPDAFSKNQPGMQATENVQEQDAARDNWLWAHDHLAVDEHFYGDVLFPLPDEGVKFSYFDEKD